MKTLLRPTATLTCLLLLAALILGLTATTQAQAIFVSVNETVNSDQLTLAVTTRAEGITPNTLGSATVDIQFDATQLQFVGPALGDVAASQGYNLDGSALNDGNDYVRVSISGGGVGTGLADGPGIDIGINTTLLVLNFTILGDPSSYFIRTGTLTVGVFVNQSNNPETGEIISCGPGVQEFGECQITTLPVELTGFSASKENETIVLSWETASETNNAGFSVEHAVGAEGTFEELSFVEGAGTTTQVRQYSFRAEGLDVGQHRFRLKQMDYDGQFEYSPEVEVTVELVGTHRLDGAYPNPFNPQTTFQLVVGQDQEVRIEVINALGQRVQVLFEGQLQANQPEKFTFEASTLPSGLYLYRAIGEMFSDTKQMMLVK